MLLTILAIAVPVVQAVVLILGVAMVIRDDWVQRNKLLTLVGFTIIALIGMGISIWQSLLSSAETTKAQAALTRALENIDRTTKDSTRVQTLNASLQLGLRDSNAQITELSKQIVAVTRETIREVTGEGGIAHVVPYYSTIDPELAAKQGVVVPDAIPTTFGVINNSKYGVLNIDLIISQRVPVGTGILGSDTLHIFSGSVPDTYPGKGATMVNAEAIIRKDRDNIFSMVLSARRVTLFQSIVISWDGQRWRNDYRLARLRDGKPQEVLHEIAKDFPYIKKPLREF